VRIAIVSNQAPFIRGGAELLAEWLADRFRREDHDAEVIRIPFAWNPAERVVDSMLAARLIRIPNADRVVALKFPAYLVPHDDKVLWLLHQFRQVYDLWGTPYQDIPNTPTGHRVRDAVVAADNHHLREVRQIFTNSTIVGERLHSHNGIASTVLYPPLAEPHAYRCDGYGDYVFYPSRINAAKRQVLAVRAMAKVKGAGRLVIAGPPDSDAALAEVREEIAAGHLERRVTLLPGWMDEAEKRELIARARAIVYIPVGEDSYGYVSLEAFESRKPVLTLADCGGVLELVVDEVNGIVAYSTELLGQAIQRVLDDEATARRMGEAGHECLREMNISWDHVISSLTR
jgi:glycosyltransferase involved in cell wall biosynthesis